MGFATYPDINEILKVPGLVFWDPSGLANESVWGTKLGFTKSGVSFEPGYNVQSYTTEETGEAITIKIFLGATPKISVVLRNYNKEALSTIFPGLSPSTPAHIKIPGGIKSGTNIGSSTYSKVLLFVPDDTTNNPILLLQKACPNILSTAKLLFSHAKEMMFPAIFDGLPKSTHDDGTAYIGPLSGATLR